MSAPNPPVPSHPRRRKSVSIIIQRDSALHALTYRIPRWGIRAAYIGAVAFAVALILLITFYGPIVRQAARVPGLVSEVERLRTDNQRVRELVAALDSLETNYERLRSMVGADLVPDPVAASTTIPIAPAIIARLPGAPARYEDGPSRPSHWPLDEAGYVTRGQAVADTAEERHPGLDIAVSVGTLVRAAGGGVILQTGEHKEYGLFVLIQHPDSLETMYGHLSRTVAVQGAAVRSGEVIGRSGNTGRSTAPHLHFEIRVNGRAVDPTTMVREDR